MCHQLIGVGLINDCGVWQIENGDYFGLLSQFV